MDLGGSLHSLAFEKVYIANSEVNHENLRALEGVCVHWHLKKVCIANSI
jgi:hypothetical protein